MSIIAWFGRSLPTRNAKVAKDGYDCVLSSISCASETCYLFSRCMMTQSSKLASFETFRVLGALIVGVCCKY